MSNKGGGSTQTTTQSNEPPSWARPALERAGQDALKFYNQGLGYNTYTGPTMAPLSDVTLGGLNSLLAATGFTGAPVTNESISSLVPEIPKAPKQPKQQAPAPSTNIHTPPYSTRLNAPSGNVFWRSSGKAPKGTEIVQRRGLWSK